MDELRFICHGRPQGKGSKRVLPIRGLNVRERIVLVDSNRNARPWAERVSSAALQALARNGHELGDFALIRGAVCVEMAFYFVRPKGHFGTGRNQDQLRAGAPREITTMPDLDKLVRNALDALTGIVWVDDAQVVELDVAKRYGEPERLEARVVSL